MVDRAIRALQKVAASRDGSTPAQASKPIRKMWAAGRLPLALVASLIFKFWAKAGILPPHEFAYGTALRTSDELPERMGQFLSLDAIDHAQIKIKTFVGNNSAKNLKPLIRYISSQRNQDCRALVAALKKGPRGGLRLTARRGEGST